MTEWVFNEVERSSYLTVDTNEIITTLEKKERIVRCKDCKHFRKRSPVVTADDYRCRNPKWMNGGIWSVQVSPDGFCAWGDAKVVE